MFSERERVKNSTWRESKSVEFLYISLFSHLAGINIADNQNVVHICQVDSIKPDLHEVAMTIYTICIVNNIRIAVEWIPRSKMYWQITIGE